MIRVYSSAASELPRFISIGGATKAELLVRLHAAGVRLNEIAQSLFVDERFTTAPSVCLVEVVLTTVAGLGLSGGGTYARVLEQAHARGLAVCPLELAPHFRLHWTDQPKSPIEHTPKKHRAPEGSVTVASAAPPDEQDLPWGFYLRRVQGTLWLRGYRSWSGHAWGSEDRLAFIRATNAA